MSGRGVESARRGAERRAEGGLGFVRDARGARAAGGRGSSRARTGDWVDAPPEHAPHALRVAELGYRNDGPPVKCASPFLASSGAVCAATRLQVAKVCVAALRDEKTFSRRVVEVVTRPEVPDGTMRVTWDADSQ